MGEKTTVSFRIAESVKQDWEDAAQRPEYESLSHLIRLSVLREISDEGAHGGAQTERDHGQDGEVIESLNRIESIVTDVQDEMSATAREVRAENSFDLEQVLLELLPTASRTLDPEEIDVETFRSEAATPRGLAGRIGADTDEVESALERLGENATAVRSRTHSEMDESYYSKVE